MLAELYRDLRIGLSFFTRLPLPSPGPVAGGELARALWSAPVVGLLVGGLGALAFWLATLVDLPPWVAAFLALAAMLAASGALHEDGLADTADGFGGGATPARKLEIMRDSRIGTYGVLALVLSLGLRAAVLAALAQPGLAAAVLVASAAGARALLPAFIQWQPSARSDGLGATAAGPPDVAVIGAGLVGLVALLACLGAGPGLVAAAMLLLAWLGLGLLARRQIGGYTGDVLGALEQLSEILVLLTAVAFFT